MDRRDDEKETKTEDKKREELNDKRNKRKSMIG